MKNQKNDHRSRYTRMIIKQALITLLKEQPLNKIGVTQLCQEAQVNRGTFYNHFYDILDVYENIENNFFQEIKDKMENTTQFDKSFFKQIMQFIYDNSTLSHLIVTNKNNSDFLNKILNFAKEKYIKEWSTNFTNIPPALLEQIFSYSSSGSIGVISKWLHDKMITPIDEIADLVARINSIILGYYLK